MKEGMVGGEVAVHMSPTVRVPQLMGRCTQLLREGTSPPPHKQETAHLSCNPAVQPVCEGGYHKQCGCQQGGVGAACVVGEEVRNHK